MPYVVGGNRVKGIGVAGPAAKIGRGIRRVVQPQLERSAILRDEDIVVCDPGTAKVILSLPSEANRCPDNFFGKRIDGTAGQTGIDGD